MLNGKEGTFENFEKESDSIVSAQNLLEKLQETNKEAELSESLYHETIKVIKNLEKEIEKKKKSRKYIPGIDLIERTLHELKRYIPEDKEEKTEKLKTFSKFIDQIKNYRKRIKSDWTENDGNPYRLLYKVAEEGIEKDFLVELSEPSKEGRYFEENWRQKRLIGPTDLDQERQEVLMQAIEKLQEACENQIEEWSIKLA